MLSTLSSDQPQDAPVGLTHAPSDAARLREEVAMYGFGCLPDALSPGLLDALQQEAQARLGLAQLAEQTTDLRYRARLVPLGPVAAQALGSPEACGLLRAVFGEDLTLSEGVSCVTVYGEGDHLGAHIDQPAEDCAVTILVYLAAIGATTPPSPETGLVLRVYGEREPQGEEPRLLIPTRAGAIVVGRGSRVWHERPRLLPGEQVVALTGCFRRADAAPASTGPDRA